MAKSTYGAEDARKNLPELLDRAHRGQPTLVTKRGKPYAVIAPPVTAKRSGRHSLLALAGTGSGLWGTDARRTLAELRDEWT